MRRMALMASGKLAGAAVCVGAGGDADGKTPTVGASVITTKGGASVAIGWVGA